MDIAALIISILALVLALVIAGFGIVVQFLMFRSSSAQTTNVAVSLGGFKTDLQSMIGELKGQTASMAGTQREQFNTMLDAFVRRPEAAAQAATEASNTERQAKELSDRLAALEERIAHSTESSNVDAALRDLRDGISAISQSASSAARLAGEVSYGMHRVLIGGLDAPGTASEFVIDVIALVREIAAKEKAGERGTMSTLYEWFKPSVLEDSYAAVNRAAVQGVVKYVPDADAMETYLELTDRGRRLVAAIESAPLGG